ncbi:MAG TPA: glycosyltransferase [Desulfomonilia bacterium]
MKVLQILPDLSAGGAEGFVTNLGVSLAGLGVEVRFFLMAGVRGERGRVLYSRLKEAGIEVDGSEEHNVRSLMNILNLAESIRSWQPDIVQANMYQTEALVCISRILTLGSVSCYIRRLANTEQVGSRSKTIVRLMPLFFSKTIACSVAVAEAYRNFIGRDCESELITIPNGGLLQQNTTTNEERRNAREKYGFPDKAFIVVHIGKMLGTGIDKGQKAHDVLIKAFARAFRGSPNHILALVGDGPLRSELEALSRYLGIAQQTCFLGLQTEPWPVLQAADIFCFPSRYEGLPNVLPEAASCGLPVLASDIPEIRNISPDDAWLLRPVNDVESFADGLLYMQKNINIYKQRAENVAQDFRKQFSMQLCAENYMNAYNQILRKHKKVVFTNMKGLNG